MTKQTSLRWGVLGTSSIARAQVIPAINGAAHSSVTAIASRDPERGREVAAAFSIPRVFPDYASLLRSGEIDVLYIPLPNALHEEWAIRAADRGLPVLCEKPLSTDAAGARRILRYFEDRNLPLMEAFMYRFHPLHARVRELLAQGVIGELREVRAHLSTNRMGVPDPQHIALNKDMGGGVLLDAGCYTINICRWMFGSEPLRVIARQDIDPAHDVDVTTSAILEFGDGRIGMASASHRAGGLSFYSLIGTDGTIEVPRGFLPGWGEVLDEPVLIVTDGRTTARRIERVDAPNQYGLMVSAFENALLRKRAVPFPPSDSVLNLAVMDAIVRSAQSGRVECVTAPE